MSQVGSCEAKTLLPRLLDEVEFGSSITITRNGRPVARLTPVVSDATRRAAARILTLREGVQMGRMSPRALIEEGRSAALQCSCWTLARALTLALPDQATDYTDAMLLRVAAAQAWVPSCVPTRWRMAN